MTRGLDMFEDVQVACSHSKEMEFKVTSTRINVVYAFGVSLSYSYTVKCTWSSAMMLIKLQGGIPNWTSWMPHRLMMVDIARGSRLGAQLEHDVSSSYQANPREFSVPFLILSILILYA
ncbi:hypothetical protein Tco_0720672 [Tanacetum coccineum]